MIRDENGLLTGYVYIDPGAETMRALSGADVRRAGAPRRNAGRIHHQLGADNTKPRNDVRKRLLLIVPLTLVADRAADSRQYQELGEDRYRDAGRAVLLDRRALDSLPARLSPRARRFGWA